MSSETKKPAISLFALEG